MYNGPFRLQHILVGSDRSDIARNALAAALVLARRAGARLTVLTTVPTLATEGVGGWRSARQRDADTGPVLAELEQWMSPALRDAPEVGAAGLAVTFGIPGIEICRFAEEHDADLIVVGRTPRSRAERILAGDTADAVARRSGVPCLFVPPGCGAPRRVLTALDGSLRGLTVLDIASRFAAAAGAEMRAATVEPERVNEPPELANLLLDGRSEALVARMGRMTAGAPGASDLLVRRGPVVPTLLALAEEVSADTIALGFHRGGPPAVIDAGSTSRRLTHTAACAVLTIPL